MRIMLVQNSAYLPSLHGAGLCNRLLLEQLAAAGHTCMAIAPSATAETLREHAELINQLGGASEGAAPPDADANLSSHGGVRVHAVRQGSRLRRYLLKQISEFAPDWIIVSSEDPGQVLLESAVEAAPGKVVYIAHTPLMLPFGPGCLVSSPAKARLLSHAAGIITLSRFMRDYIQNWGGLDSHALYVNAYGQGPFPDLARFDRGFVTLINPCAYKGLPVLLELARRLPQVSFAAVPTWGARADDLDQMRRCPNITLLRASARIDDVLAQTRALLAPSLWTEAFGMVVVEAMLRGLPVLASDSGGLPEAKLGVDYVLPVRQISKYEERPRADRSTAIEPVVEAQEVGPWAAALTELLGDRWRYERLSGESKRAAERFVGGIRGDEVERYLAGLGGGRAEGSGGAGRRPEAAAGPQIGQGQGGPLQQLSPQKRALLALRLKRALSDKSLQSPDTTDRPE